MDQVEVQPPASGGADDDRDIPIREGLYILTNKMSRTVLDLPGSKSGTDCHGWSQNRDGGIVAQLWILQKSSSSGTYTLRSFRYSTFLDVWLGKSDNGARVIGHIDPNQRWRLVQCAPHYHTIQNFHTNTYLEISGGNPANGTKVTCSSAPLERDHQLWILDRVSVSGQEIGALLQQWKPDLLTRLLLPRGEAAEYFVLPSVLRRELWEQTKLQQQPVRPYLFDYDVFVIKCKGKVHSWARDAFPAESRGFGVLIGIIYGAAKEEPRAYNWYLTDDMCSLVFFDPQTGKEYSAAALDGVGFEPTFATL